MINDILEKGRITKRMSYVCPPDASSAGPLKKLPLKVTVSSMPVKRTMCNLLPKVEVGLTFINATAPSCGQVKLEKLCFLDRDSNPHIRENRMPGALRQLRRFTRMGVCPNYTISYAVKAGITKVSIFWAIHLIMLIYIYNIWIKCAVLLLLFFLFFIFI